MHQQKNRKMHKLLRPGLKFYAHSIEPWALRRTVSNYGQDVETEPQRNELYLIREDGSIQAVFDPNRKIVWQIHANENGSFYSQPGQGLKQCIILYHGNLSQEAVIYEDEDDGEPEVNSY
jgi:hypothetical protein